MIAGGADSDLERAEQLHEESAAMQAACAAMLHMIEQQGAALMSNPNLVAKERTRIINCAIVALGNLQIPVKATKIKDTFRHKSASALLGAARKAVRKDDSRKRPASPSLREGRASPAAADGYGEDGAADAGDRSAVMDE